MLLKRLLGGFLSLTLLTAELTGKKAFFPHEYRH